MTTRKPMAEFLVYEASSWGNAHFLQISGGLFLIIMIAVLAFALQSALDRGTSESISRSVLAVVALIFTGGYTKLAFDYDNLADSANNTANRAGLLLRSGDIEPLIAVKLVHEYQISRAGAPMLPALLWKIMESDLNQTWLRVRGGQ